MVGFVVVALSVVLNMVKVFDKTIEFYVSAGGYLLQNVGTMLFCTLPPRKFDIDGAFDKLTLTMSHDLTQISPAWK